MAGGVREEAYWLGGRGAGVSIVVLWVGRNAMHLGRIWGNRWSLWLRLRGHGANWPSCC
jgi:hypothetical protein